MRRIVLVVVVAALMLMTVVSPAFAQYINDPDLTQVGSVMTGDYQPGGINVDNGGGSGGGSPGGYYLPPWAYLSCWDPGPFGYEWDC